MYSIKHNLENTIEIKKSKFITKLYKINSIDEINTILKDLKKEFKDSTHICYAYVVNGLEKCSDDGEPSGTAGLPILNILKKNNLTNIVAVVIRYFGGIKLGAGGLVRAYSNAIIETLKLGSIIELEEANLIAIEFDYNQTKTVDLLLKNKTIIEKTYNSTISYKFYNSKKDNELVKELEKAVQKLSIIDNILIEKNW